MKKVIELQYILLLLISFFFLGFVKRPILIFAYIILLISILTDLLSSRAAQKKRSNFFLISDFIAIANYASMASIFTYVSFSGTEFARLLFHYGVIFANYIAWNIVMIIGATPKSKNFFLKYTIIEVPLLVFVIVSILSVTHILSVSILNNRTYVLITIVIGHLIILFLWLFDTYARPYLRTKSKL